jgi:hypothetical protein
MTGVLVGGMKVQLEGGHVCTPFMAGSFKEASVFHDGVAGANGSGIVMAFLSWAKTVLMGMYVVHSCLMALVSIFVVLMMPYVIQRWLRGWGQVTLPQPVVEELEVGDIAPSNGAVIECLHVD